MPARPGASDCPLFGESRCWRREGRPGSVCAAGSGPHPWGDGAREGELHNLPWESVCVPLCVYCASLGLSDPLASDCSCPRNARPGWEEQKVPGTRNHSGWPPSGPLFLGWVTLSKVLDPSEPLFPHL